MSKLSVEEFLDYLRKSELTELSNLEAALQTISSEGDKMRLGDADYLAGMLIRKGLITRWHVRQLMKRKYKGFFLRQYRIMDHLGTGGMSTVYLAEHTMMHRLVAIKILPKKKMANSAYLDRFIKEAQAIAALNHPNIVQAYDIDRYDDIHYIVMEYFEGNNLRQLVDKEGPLPYEDAVSYIRQSAEGLFHAHRIGVIHRDVKPENILANAEGTAKLLDLGLALLKEGDESNSSTNQDNILGTADYLAPEQAINSNKIDGRADIYGLGCTLYFCLTGHPPFPFGTIPQRLLAHQRETPASILLDRPDCPDDLVEICSKMMAKKPDDRFQTAREVTDILGRWLVRHGFALPEELGIKSSGSQENGDDILTNQLSFLNDPWSATGLGDREDERRGGVGIGSEDVVNLFGSSLGIGSKAGIDDTKTAGHPDNEDDILLSQRVRDEREKTDPFSLAINDFETEQSGEHTATQEPACTKPSSKQNTIRTIPAQKKREVIVTTSPQWYHNIPVWFWALFASGYILAIIMGCLFFVAIMMNMSK